MMTATTSNLLCGLHLQNHDGVWEVACSPHSWLSEACEQHGLQPRRINYQEGYDLYMKETWHRLRDLYLKKRPRRIWFSLPCTKWCPWTSVNYNTPEKQETLEAARRKERKLLWEAASFIKYVLEVDDEVKIYFEWPHPCFGWKQQPMVNLERHLEATGYMWMTCRVDGCNYGMKNSDDGAFIRKKWMIKTNDENFHKNFRAKVCPGNHQHVTIEGNLTSQTACYPWRMVQAIARHWRDQTTPARHLRLLHQQLVERDEEDETPLPPNDLTYHELDPAPEVELENPRDELPEGLYTITATEIQSAEHFAQAAMNEKDFHFVTLERLLMMLRPRSLMNSSVHHRGTQPGVNSLLFGAFSHGNFRGITRRTMKFPQCVLYINKFLQHDVPDGTWSSFVINFDCQTRLHCDHHNARGSYNHLVGTGTYSGGGLWLQGQPPDGYVAVKRRSERGYMMTGYVLPTKYKVVTFDPFNLHATQSWTGLRLSVSAYTTRLDLRENYKQRWNIKNLVVKCHHKNIKNLKNLLVKSHKNLKSFSLYHNMNDKRGRWKSEAVAVDAGEWIPPKTKVKVKFLVFMDVATKLRVIHPLFTYGFLEMRAESGQDLIRSFSERWLGLFPKPKFLLLDSAKSFSSEMVHDFLSEINVTPHYVAEKESWAHGVIEASMMDIKHTASAIHMEDLSQDPMVTLQLTASALNSTETTAGFSANQWAFGTEYNVTDEDIRTYETVEPRIEFTKLVTARVKAEEVARTFQTMDLVKDLDALFFMKYFLIKMRETIGGTLCGSKILQSGGRWRIFCLPGNIRTSRIKYLEKENVNFLHYHNDRIQPQPCCPEDEQFERLRFNLETMWYLKQYKIVYDMKRLRKICHPTNQEFLKIEFDLGEGLSNRQYKQLARNPVLYMTKKMRDCEVTLTKLSEPERRLFARAKSKEVDSFIKNEAVRACLDQKEIKEAYTSGRIIKARWVLTWKLVPTEEQAEAREDAMKNPNTMHSKDGKKKAKARIVLLGYQHPSLLDSSFKTASPVQSLMGRNLLYLMSVQHQWPLEGLDLATAFLQTQPTEADRNLWTTGVEELRTALGIDGPGLMRILKNVYGSTTAPRGLWLDLHKTLTKLGGVPVLGERCLWIWKSQTEMDNGKPRVIGAMGGHVDDFHRLGDNNSEEWKAIKVQVDTAYKWGTAKTGSYRHAGTDVVTSKDADGNLQVTVDQDYYVDALQDINIDPDRINAKGQMNKAEFEACRTSLGALQWLAIQTQPQLCSRYNLLLTELVTQNDMETAREIQAMIGEVRQEPFRLHFRKLKDVKHWSDMVFVSMGDQAHNNRPKGESTGGLITMAAGPSCVNGAISPMILLSWRSWKLKRRAIGSNDAEIQAVLEAEDNNFRLRLLWSELHGAGGLQERELRQDLVEQVENQTLALKGIVCTDSRGGYDAIEVNESPLLGLSNMRAALQAFQLRDNLRRAGCTLRWLASDYDLADALTKKRADSRYGLVKFLRPKIRGGGYKFVDFGQNFVDFGQKFMDLGQEFVDLGQNFADLGQKFADLGQKFVDLGRAQGQNHISAAKRRRSSCVAVLNSFSGRCFPAEWGFWPWVRRCEVTDFVLSNVMGF
ncbi:unnamed protein product [Symbiodinium sp. KB8]|nr:unnamed protein product [Symbiodinium sp. KB8]